MPYWWLKFGLERTQAWPARLAVAPAPTLVIYVYSGSDPEYLSNLQFFIKEAIKPNDGCDYVIVLQEDPAWADPLPSLPLLPSNTRLLRHPNACFDLGTVGWVLDTQIPNIHKYTYFLWVNSSVRGPFLPPYVRQRLHWTRPLTSLLTPLVKLVGPTISCGGTHDKPTSPHVQSYVVATDREGLVVLQTATPTGPGPLSCFKEMAEVVEHGELGASRAILNAGYGLDCLMVRYQGIDWRKEAAVAGRGGADVTVLCNEGTNPLQPGFNDGVDVGLYEVMFIKVKRSLLEAGWPSAMAAAAAARHLSAADAGGDMLIKAARHNSWWDEGGGAEAAEADARRRGAACFDWKFYLDANAYDIGFYRDLEDPEGEAWTQFIEMGIFEGRPHRREAVKIRAESEVEAAAAARAAVRAGRASLAQLRQELGARTAAENAAATAAAAIAADAATLKKQKATGWAPRVGDFVWVPRLNARAKVLAVDASGGTLQLQAGLMKVSATTGEVRQRQ